MSVLITGRNRRSFDVDSHEDMTLAKNFIETHKWGIGGCPFVCEYPYSSVPDMIRDKITHAFFKIPFNSKHHTFLR